MDIVLALGHSKSVVFSRSNKQSAATQEVSNDSIGTHHREELRNRHAAQLGRDSVGPVLRWDLAESPSYFHTFCQPLPRRFEAEYVGISHNKGSSSLSLIFFLL